MGCAAKVYMILCVGEILADLIGMQKDGAFFYERKAGGAPFNVACGAKQFGARSAFAGSVGTDTVGLFLEKFARARQLDELVLRKDEERNTTLAFVELDESGERSFCFYRKNTADYILPAIDDSLLSRADIVHIGSLMLSEEQGREYAAALAKRVKEAGKCVSFDVNFRADIFRNEAEAVRIYRELIALADIVKFSEDEVAIFTEEYVHALSNKLICISLGAKGSEWRWNEKTGRVPSLRVRPVDTTGAGDAFYAGVLAKLDGVPRAEWTEEFLCGVFAFANVCGALNTLGRGAIDHLPTLREIEEKFREIG